MVNHVLVGVLLFIFLASCCKAERLTFEAVEHSEGLIPLYLRMMVLCGLSQMKGHTIFQCCSVSFLLPV